MPGMNDPGATDDNPAMNTENVVFPLNKITVRFASLERTRHRFIPAALITTATAAFCQLYLSKKRGRNRVTLFGESEKLDLQP